MSTEQHLAPPAAQQPELFENPGLEEHRGRLSDKDPRAAKRVELQIAILFGISVLGSIAAVVGYFAIPLDSTLGNVRLSNLVLGVGLGLGMLGIGVAAIHWAKSLMSTVEYIEERHPQRSSDETRATAAAMMKHGVEDSGIGRRPVLKGAVAGAAALAPLPFLVPLVGNLGDDWNVSKFRHTLWGETPEEFSGQLPDGGLGRRLAIDPTDTPIRAADVTIGSVFHVIPHGLNEAEHFYEEKAKAVVLLVRLDPTLLKEPDNRKDWSYEGIVAYSKICTHVGCPVALYEQQTHHLLCPCHQSTFDITDQAKVVFGPAKRPLPQLPIAVDDEGYLVARSDFDEPIGPSYWERLK
ncbi:cytochrome bc1 complex Rieske iron-sulfur subunit [Georgenia subflava]|uniref:Cytochrome bc1 complex Rieske iron-sulfur subunit n=1 Tax=Georgenia subflava TaxID=1622177 RepID=A0A6N7EMC1_9MICO|nr:Rieske 2Fe-2S domain-containing protein [Georgenia subflava]MPV38581.1 Rieske 2Fe-2S domain-containing protein [Georgenia subflava]